MCGTSRARIVGDHHDRLPELAVQPVEQVQDVRGRLAVQIPGRLVGDHQQRIAHERARDRNALLLAARQLVRIMPHPVRQADHAEQQFDPLAPFRARQLCQLQRKFDVLERGQHRHQVVELEDEAHVARTPLGQFSLAEPGDVLAGHREPTRSGLSMPATRFSSVLLPDPDGPIIATKSPSRMTRVMSVSTGSTCPPRT